jgi:uncharacterized protein YjbJ (UPF0337 family)
MELNQQVLQSNWDEIRGKIKEHWAKRNDDDVNSFNGNIDQLIGRIQQKTGESRDSIERFLSQATERMGSMLQQAGDAVENATQQVRQGLRQGYDSLTDGYAGAQRMVHDRPVQAVGITFVLGVLTGLGIGLLLRPKPNYSSDHMGRRVLDTLSNVLPEPLASRCRS